MNRIPAYVLVLLLISSAAAWAQAEGGELQPNRLRWLVTFSAGVDNAEAASLAAEFDLPLIEQGDYASHYLIQFQLPPGDDLMRRLRNHPRIAIIEREARYTTTARTLPLGSNDPLRPRQWPLDMIRLEQAHLLNFGSDPGVTVAVLDTGIAYADGNGRGSAPDLEGAIVHPGFDFVSMDEEPLDEGDGRIGHGTMMAGIIAQTTFNQRGTAGIAFNAALMPVRVVNKRGIARAGDLARGIRYAVANGASLIVLGVSGPAASETVNEAITFAWENGVAVISPGGNQPGYSHPASSSMAISAGALNAAGDPAWYSLGGEPEDVFAPGGDLRSGVDANGDGFPDGILVHTFAGSNTEFDYFYVDGTSPAAAHVAGVAALVLSSSRQATPLSLLHALTSGSAETPGIPVLDAYVALRHFWDRERLIR